MREQPGNNEAGNEADPGEDEWDRECRREVSICYEYNEDLQAEWMEEPASQYPEHKWVISQKGWKARVELEVQADYRNPDRFNMWVYKHFWGYGIQEVIENWFVEFNNAYRSKALGTQLQLWHHLHPMLLWLLDYNMYAWMRSSDEPRRNQTVETILVALLTAMHRLDDAGKLTASSEFKDVSIVMGLSACFYDRFVGMRHWKKCFKYGRSLIGYIKKVNIPAEESVSLGIDEFIKKTEEMEQITIPVLRTWSVGMKDPFFWSRKFSCFFGRGSTKLRVGKHEYNILHFPQMKRVEYGDEGKDALADMSDKDLKDCQDGKKWLHFR